VTVNSVVAGSHKTITAIFTPPTCFPCAGQSLPGPLPAGSYPRRPPVVALACGSTPFILKLYGDIDDDGNMKYIEYTCDSSTGPPTTGGNLYRQVLAYDDVPAAKNQSSDGLNGCIVQHHAQSARSWHDYGCTMALNTRRNRWAPTLRCGRVRHFNRADAKQGPSDPSVSDGNQGFIECFAAQRLRGLAARQRQRGQSHPADAADSRRIYFLKIWNRGLL